MTIWDRVKAVKPLEPYHPWSAWHLSIEDYIEGAYYRLHGDKESPFNFLLILIHFESLRKIHKRKGWDKSGTEIRIRVFRDSSMY